MQTNGMANAQPRSHEPGDKPVLKTSSPLFIHYVHDMQRAVAFYRNVFDAQLTFESAGWSTFAFDSFELALHILYPGHHDDAVIPNAGLNLLVASIEAARDAIENNGGAMRELREPDDFVPVRVASFVDTEGNGFELRQHVAGDASS